MNDFEKLIYNSSEPCDLYNRTTPQEQTETNKGLEANEETGTQGLTGQPGGAGDSEAQPILMVIPITEPAKVLEPLQVTVAPTAALVPSTQPLEATSSLPTMLLQSTAVSSSSSLASVTASSLSLLTFSSERYGKYGLLRLHILFNWMILIESCKQKGVQSVFIVVVIRSV